MALARERSGIEFIEVIEIAGGVGPVGAIDSLTVHFNDNDNPHQRFIRT